MMKLRLLSVPIGCPIRERLYLRGETGFVFLGGFRMGGLGNGNLQIACLLLLG